MKISAHTCQIQRIAKVYVDVTIAKYYAHYFSKLFEFGYDYPPMLCAEVVYVGERAGPAGFEPAICSFPQK